MTTRVWWLMLVVSIALNASCKAPNELFCCLTAEDCEANGVSGETRPCDEGLACKENACVAASCSTEGCTEAAPTCETATDTCVGCTDSAECSRFAETDVCDTSSGSCVECLAPSDCEADRPICDGGSCRGCQFDSECDSGACANDGTCAAEDAAVYVSPSGTNAGTCTRSAPCKTLQFALTRTTVTRSHLVLAPGTYANVGLVDISASTTAATQIAIHGGGATLTESGSDGPSMFRLGIQTTLRDLDISYGNFGAAIQVEASTLIERIKIRGLGDGDLSGISVNGPAIVRDVVIEDAHRGLQVSSGTLMLDGAVLRPRTNGIKAIDNATLEIKNVLIYGGTLAGIDLTDGSLVGGSIEFVTISNTGSNSTTNAGLTCPISTFPVRSTIIWTPGVARPAASNCGFVSTIAGPMGVAGAMNLDPRFVNPASDDYHLGANSPARDVVDTGPALDFERDPRPSGARFDIGADEAP